MNARSLAVRTMPVPVKEMLVKAMKKLDLYLIKLFSKSGVTASLYYFLINRAFDREHRAVLLGRLEFEASSNARDQHSNPLLRRNTHRLEKGLIMRSRKKVFAESYIAETVACYAGNSNGQQGGCIEERKWAHDVLQCYFESCGSSQAIDEARKVFYSGSLQPQPGNYVPYPHSDLPPCPIDYDCIHTLFKRRRSVRWYLDEKVDIELIKRAASAASMAPSACNRQPYRFYVANNSTKAAEIAACAMGTVGFAENLPCIIAVIGDLSAYPEERDRHVIYIDGALAAMQLMLALETLGLSSCPINWPDIESREIKLKKKLALKYYERPIMLLAVGHPDPQGGIPYSQKKTGHELVKEI